MIGSNVYVGAGAKVERSVIFDNVTIGKGAIVRNAILDKNVIVPDGVTIGVDVDEDRRRGFTVSDAGVVAWPRTSWSSPSRPDLARRPQQAVPGGVARQHDRVLLGDPVHRGHHVAQVHDQRAVLRPVRADRSAVPSSSASPVNPDRTRATRAESGTAMASPASASSASRGPGTRAPTR